MGKEFFGVWGGNEFYSVFPTEMQCRLCGDDIRPVTVREAKEGEEPTHWGWESPEGTWSMIYPGEVLLDLCFPSHNAKQEEAEGRGRVLRLIVTEEEG